jgi:hypothetical protein
MDSNPEEFGDGGRWQGLILKYRTYLPAADRLAMEDKLNALRLDVFHKDVMKELLAEPNDDAAVDPSFYRGTRPGTQVIGTTVPTAAVSPYINAYQNALSNTGVGSALTNTPSNVNLSNQSIKDIAAALSQYAANTWRP